MDDNVNFEEIKKLVKDFSDKRNWKKYHHPKELAISLLLEASELLEIFQWKEKENIEQIKQNEEMLNDIKREIADVIIYSVNLANQLDIDLSESIYEKIEENNRKYPIEKAKGRHVKYTGI